MAVWNSVITNNGVSLLNSITGTDTLTISRVVLGKLTTADLYSATTISGAVLPATVSSISNTTSGLNVEVQTTNSTVQNTTNFTVKQVGIYAYKDSATDEVLLCIAQAQEDTYDTLPVFTTYDSAVTLVYKFILTLSNTDSIIVNATIGGMVSSTDFEAYEPTLNTLHTDLYVASKSGDYTTTASAITAANIAYTTDNKYKSVLSSPSVSNVRASTAGVQEYELCSPNGVDGGNIPVQEPVEYRTLPYAGGLIAVRSDDGIRNWRVADTVFGNVAPCAYYSNLGIPVTHAIITDYIGQTIGNTARFTLTDIYDLNYAHGCEIACHSQTHGTTALTYDTAMYEIIGSKQKLENLSISGLGTADDKLGIKVNTFIQPGGWIDNDYISTRGLCDTSLSARLIRQNYACSMAYASFHCGFANSGQKYFSGSISIENLHSVIANNALERWLKTIAVMGARVTVLIHNPFSTTTVKNDVKALADAIAAVRDGNGAKIHPVTVASYLLGRTQSTESNMCKIDFSEFAENTDLAALTTTDSLASNYPAGLPYKFWNSNNNCTFTTGADSTAANLVSGIIKTVDSSEDCVKILQSGTSVLPYVQISLELEQGRAYEISYSIKSASGTSNNTREFFSASGNNSDGSAVTFALKNTYYTAGTTNYTRIHRCISIPTWSNGLLTFYVRTNASGDALYLKNITINPL